MDKNTHAELDALLAKLTEDLQEAQLSIGLAGLQIAETMFAAIAKQVEDVEANLKANH